ncbi:MAG: protein kinase [Planctomycetes bacterium]|nr:protein kinase [Planctomycetota bacterium]
MSQTAFLSSIAAFKSLPPREVERLSTQCELVRFVQGAQIIRRGDPGDAMFIIRKGEVRVPVIDAQGREKFVARLGAGEFFGEMALLTGEPRTADVFAETAVECLVIRRQPLQAFLGQHPRVASFLTEILGKRLLEGAGVQQVGKYKLVGELGRGGMAIVFEGLHPTLNTAVAIKMLSHELVYDEDFATRFKNEAKIIGALKHENIVSVIDSEEAYATFFIIMEKVTGTVLSRLIDTRGVLPFDESRSILRQLASALDCAHTHGIVHRDVKPANVIVESGGRVKLMDFGIAKTRAEAQKDDEDIVGTAEYMSPEQALGRKMDGRSDLYSLGIMAYEMLTGKLPFDSHDPYEILRMHVRDAVPSPRATNPRVPEDLEQLVRRSTAKRPEDRFQTGREIVEFLSAAEPKAGLDLSRAKGHVLTLIYDGPQEDAVRDFLRRSLTEAKKIPGLRVGVSDMGKIY